MLAEINALATGYEETGHDPNAAAIRRDLLADKRFSERDIPSERRIRQIVDERAPDESDPWEPTTATADVDPALALPVLAHAIGATEGKRRHLTIAEAQVVTMVRSVAPTMVPGMALAVAREYISGPTAKEDLDAFLAFAPWSGREARAVYEVALQDGWMQPPGAWMRQQQMEDAVADVNRMRIAMRARPKEKAAKTKTARRSARRGSEA